MDCGGFVLEMSRAFFRLPVLVVFVDAVGLGVCCKWIGVVGTERIECGCFVLAWGVVSILLGSGWAGVC